MTKSLIHSKSLIFLFLVTIFLSTTSRSHAVSKTHTPQSISDLALYANKYPFDKIRGLDFWSVPELKDLLEATLSSSSYLKFKSYSQTGTSTPIVKYQNYLFTSICMAHNCASERFEFIIDLNSSKVFLCQTQEDQAPENSAQWYGSPQPQRSITTGSCPQFDDSPGNLTDAYIHSLINEIPEELN